MDKIMVIKVISKLQIVCAIGLQLKQFPDLSHNQLP